MLKIGEFSKLSRISIRMLRHYDEIGLLKPAEIDRFTDYRYYREDQLPKAGRIAALKDMGFSLADIVRILEVYDDREQLERFSYYKVVVYRAPLQELVLHCWGCCGLVHPSYRLTVLERLQPQPSLFVR